MDDAIDLAGPAFGIRFLMRWNGVAALAIALSTAATTSLAIVGIESRSEDLFLSLVGAAILSFPILSGLGHGWLMRGGLRRSTLWGTLTGGGIVAATVGVIAVAITLSEFWQPPIWQIAVWFARHLSLDVPPSTWLAYAAAGVLFGLILGATQAAALDLGWAERLRWVAASAASGLPATTWLYLCVEVDDISNGLLRRIAESLPVPDHWNVLPIAVPVAMILCLCFTLPTGFVMERQLRRHRRATAESLVRRFE
jgi:hypothetical protein